MLDDGLLYERARAESLGLDARGGLMERAERFVFLGVALAFDILVPVLWVMLVLTAFTAVHRFAWRSLLAAATARRSAHTRKVDRPATFFAFLVIYNGAPTTSVCAGVTRLNWSMP